MRRPRSLKICRPYSSNEPVLVYSDICVIEKDQKRKDQYTLKNVDNIVVMDLDPKTIEFTQYIFVINIII